MKRIVLTFFTLIAIQLSCSFAQQNDYITTIVDTIITFDPETYAESIKIVKKESITNLDYFKTFKLSGKMVADDVNITMVVKGTNELDSRRMIIERPVEISKSDIEKVAPHLMPTFIARYLKIKE